MKATRSIKLLAALFVAGLLSCSAVKQSSSSPTKKLITALQKGQDFFASGETFDGDLILQEIIKSQKSRSTYIESELVFEGCIFLGKIQLKPTEGKSLYFEKEVIFESCEFKKELTINDATFMARFQMGSNLCRHSLDLQRNKFRSICRIDENEVGQDLILQYSILHENLSLFGNTLGRHMSLQGLSVYGKSQLGNTTLFGSVDISNCHFHEDFSIDYAKKGKKLLAGNSTFYGRCYIKEIDDFTMADLSSSAIFGRYLFSSKNDLVPNTKGTILYRNISN